MRLQVAALFFVTALFLGTDGEASWEGLLGKHFSFEDYTWWQLMPVHSDAQHYCG